MAIRATAIRLFVSSTFVDFKREREILETRVFPAIQAHCRRNQFDFQAVDLRWGISERDARSQQTLRVCLNEVTLCVQTALRPYFLILLGDRYGWRPLPEFIDRDEFKQLAAWLASRAGSAHRATVTLLQRWYRLDRNHVPPRHALQPRRRAASNRLHWQAVEERLRRALQTAAAACGLQDETQAKYRLSATAQEIRRGVILASRAKEVDDVKEHVLCFRRTVAGAGREHVHGRAEDGSADAEAIDDLAELSRTLRATLGSRMVEYRVAGTDAAARERYERRFERDARRMLMGMVDVELARQEQFRGAEQEWQAHVEFGRERTERMIGREDLIDRIDTFLDARGARAMLVSGRGGMGKTTLLAKAAAMATSAHRGIVTLQRYIGISATASTSRTLLEDLLRELAAGTGMTWDKSEDIVALGRELRRLLGLAASLTANGILLVLDGLDQLPPEEASRILEWLPWPAPAGVALMVSVLENTGAEVDLCERLMRGMPNAQRLRIGGLESQVGLEVLRALLRESDRRLQPAQEQAVMAGFESDPAPLYMRIASILAKRWTAYDGLAVRSPTLPNSTAGLIRRLLATLGTELGHEPAIVAGTFALLLSSRRGMTEGELLSLLWEDDAVRQVVPVPPDRTVPLSSLPMIYWSRFRDDLRDYLVSRPGDGELLLGFFHRVFDETARRTFLGNPAVRTATHRAIAGHFAVQPDEVARESGGAPMPNLRRLSELPHQLIQMADAQALSELLASASYFRAKLVAGLSDDLWAEWQRCSQMMAPAQRTGLANRLSERVVGALEDPQTARHLSTLDLHNGLLYRDAEGFYATFLERCIPALRNSPLARSRRVADTRIELMARLANTRRRAGLLDTAERELSGLLPRLRQRQRGAALSSTVEYELGYVNFLRGSLDTAAEWFTRSARTARLSSHPVSEWMSRCLAATARWQVAVARCEQLQEAPHYIKVLTSAERVFAQHVTADGNALRWLYNVSFHRFNVAFRTDDKASARRFAREVIEHPWSGQFDQNGRDSILIGSRLSMVEGDLPGGATRLLRHARSLATLAEGRAEHYLDAGTAYWMAGEHARARRIWTEGYTLSTEAGNTPWLRLIQQALQWPRQQQENAAR